MLGCIAKIKETLCSVSFVVELSSLNSNKTQKILAFKEKANLTPDNIISQGDNSAHTKINDLGEREVRRLKQSQKILSEAEIVEMAKAYQGGATTYQLAERYGADRSTITRALRKNGVNVTKEKAQVRLDPENVIRMYSEFHTTDEIAKLYGVHPRSVIKCLRDHGVRIRGRWDYPK